MKVIVGLGNPDKKYENTRHNIGAMVIARLSKLWGITLARRNPHALVGQGVVGEETVVLARPRTYMNQSGGPVAYLVNRFHIPLEDLLIIYDEMDLPLGTTRIRPGGSNGGHNGLRSIHAHIGPDYGRVRLGIGHPGDKDKVTGHVLKNFAKADAEWVEKVLDALAEHAGLLIDGEDSAYMNKAAEASRQKENGGNGV
ncbi:MAG: aminoacyl-tRNA hydrolase [Chloroflexi bacterium]|nr:aminoacyl-tRNA hydrolase [Chloroflexota bacterium]